MTKPPIGTIVYAKKHSTFFYDREEKPHTVISYHKQKKGNVVAIIETGQKVSFGELTDVPCSKMECGNCKWHKKE